RPLEMIISGGRLLLSERDQKQELSLPIDVFFRSLAQDCGLHAVAIVLSGGGSDGSRGVRDIYDAGGFVIVQDAESAQFDGMPKTARDSGVAHWLLAPSDMPRVLMEHVARRPTDPSVDAPVLTSDEQGFAPVYRMLQDEFGLDFTHYKPSTVTRRIERRLALARTQDIDEYVRRLKSDHDELDVLYRDLLIGVTRFFRDEKPYQILEEQVLPELFQGQKRGTPLRVWVAGCATGEEAYSLAILLADLMRKYGERSVKIFATDVHKGSLEYAARAVYEEDALANVSPERLERYFLRSGSTYQVVPDLRQMIVFAAHNVMEDAPFTRVDLISCRNLLIYLQPFAQQKVLSFFHFSLNRGGTLFLGSSETLGTMGHDFATVDKHWRIYTKRSDARMPVDPRLQLGPAGHSRGVTPRTQTAVPQYSLTQLLGTYDALLDEVMPPSLLVSDRGELIHSFAGASRFLRLQDGRQGLDVLDMVNTDLKMVLVGGLKRALHEPASISFKGVRASAGDDRPYKVSIRRVRSRTAGISHLLISFEEIENGAASLRPPATEIELDQLSREQLGALEAELSHTKENLQAAIEELETSNEELQASNEELQASNEELQSTNEELQSVNEELYTVNTEYQRKITELTELTNDMDNLLSSTEVGTIFLDSQLMIRKFTPQIAQAFSLLPHDVGRSIDTFAHKMEHPELVEHLRRVLATGTPVERESRDSRGKVFFVRIFPYRARGGVDGVVLTLIDVSGLRAAEDALFHERYLLNSLMFSVPDAIYFKDARGRFIRTNDAMASRLGLHDPREAAGKVADDMPNREVAVALAKEDHAVLQTGEAQHYKLEKRIGNEGLAEWDLVTRLPLKADDDAIVGVIAIYRNVTEQKRAEEKIQEAVRRRDQFLAMLSHELRNPLGAMVTATALLKPAIQEHPNTKKLLAVLERQSHQMARLLDDLLEASRVTQNKIELRRGVIDLRTAVRDAADAVRTIMAERGVNFSMQLDQEPIYVDGDPARLQQVQVNLLSNAAKYTPRGGNVHLDVQRLDGHALIRVRDDGAGIPRDMLDSVFDLFVQSSRTLDRAAGGLGVGLTLVRSLVAMHGGTIEAHSDGDGKGSEFVVRFPLVTGSAEKEG
ncbi:MAG TPA: CheR family methyltransferase, partial [Polyangiaceae bacterium]|nr:CheR family methyltransferase [Polyangiaceae bacterium]